MKPPAPAATFPVGAKTLVAVPPVAFAPPLAHQGGWDEILMVVAPLGVIGLLLWIANRRVSAQIAADGAASPDNAGTDSTTDRTGGDVSR